MKRYRDLILCSIVILLLSLQALGMLGSDRSIQWQQEIGAEAARTAILYSYFFNVGIPVAYAISLELLKAKRPIFFKPIWGVLLTGWLAFQALRIPNSKPFQWAVVAMGLLMLISLLSDVRRDA